MHSGQERQEAASHRSGATRGLPLRYWIGAGRSPSHHHHGFPGSRTYAKFADASRDHAGNAGGGRNCQSPADAQGRAGSAARLGPLHVAATRHARPAQGRGHRPGRNERGRCAGGPDAGGPAGRALGGIRAVEQLRARAAAPQGSPRPRFLRRPDARGGHHRHRATRGAQLQAAARQPLPDPDEVPR